MGRAVRREPCLLARITHGPEGWAYVIASPHRAGPTLAEKSRCVPLGVKEGEKKSRQRDLSLRLASLPISDARFPHPRNPAGSLPANSLPPLRSIRRSVGWTECVTSSNVRVRGGASAVRIYLLFEWTMYESCCKKNWHAKFLYANLAHDYRLFCKFFWKRSYRT